MAEPAVDPYHALREKFDRLPRFGKLRFLSVCAERIVPLYSALWLRPMSLIQQRKLDLASEGIDRYACNPHSIDRVTLELMNENVGAAGIACAVECNNKHATTVSMVIGSLESVFEYIIHNKANSEIIAFTYQWAIMDTVCKDRPMLEKTINYDVTLLMNECKEQNINNDTPVCGVLLRPIWRFGKPANWPDESIAFGAQVLGGLVMNGTLTRLLGIFR